VLVGGILTVWVITWRVAWPLILVALILPLAVWAAGRRGISLPPARAFLALFVVPVLLVAWSGANWGAEAGGASQWRSNVLLGLALCGLVILIATPIYYRQKPRTWVLVAAALISLIFLLSATFVGSMAIPNTWL
jgi:peptidoglycan/LPS O-acetylase OafA/YrhL